MVPVSSSTSSTSASYLQAGVQVVVKESETRMFGRGGGCAAAAPLKAAPLTQPPRSPDAPPFPRCVHQGSSAFPDCFLRVLVFLQWGMVGGGSGVGGALLPAGLLPRRCAVQLDCGDLGVINWGGWEPLKACSATPKGWS